MVLLAIAQASCDKMRIDEDLSDCEEQDVLFSMTYDLRVVTNITTELTTVLSTVADAPIRAALQAYLSPIFTDHANDVDLSFYNTEKPMERLHHVTDIMAAQQKSYSINLPARRYFHNALANLAGNNAISLVLDDYRHTAALRQQTTTLVPNPTPGTYPDAVAPQTTGVFSARLPMDVLAATDQHFDVHLYMANCATALIIDPRTCGVTDIRIYTTGFANSFTVADSLYSFTTPYYVLADRLPVTGSTQFCFCSVHYPSQDPASSRTIIETEDPFIAEDEKTTVWHYECYVTLTDGTITKTDLNIMKPLRPGQLKIIKGWLDNTGGVHTLDTAVGISVTLNWNSGGGYTPSL